MSSNKVNQYQIIEVSWEEKYLKGRTHPQSVRILTPGFLDELKKLLYAEGDESFHEYFDHVVAAKEGGKRPEKTIIHLNCLLTLYAAN